MENKKYDPTEKLKNLLDKETKKAKADLRETAKSGIFKKVLIGVAIVVGIATCNFFQSDEYKDLKVEMALKGDTAALDSYNIVKAKREFKKKEDELFMYGECYWANVRIKENLNDPSSFEHVKTTFVKLGGGMYKARVSYRAKNAFGALVKEVAIVVIDINGNLYDLQIE